MAEKDVNSETECQTLLIHPETIDAVRNSTPNDDQLMRLSEFFKIFGDPTRMKILYALFHAELCVCDISVVIGISQSAVSHQLKLLRQSQLVAFRREGKTVFYSLNDEHVRQIVKMGMVHINE